MNSQLSFSIQRSLFYVALALLPSEKSHSDITLDGSLNTVTPVISAPQYTIEAAYGLQKGSNLFHSFKQFNLNKGETATFKASNSIENIISRITDGEKSYINGTIATETANNVNLWMVNPAGWLFGEHAKLNVQGSFHTSSADAVNLADDSQFFAEINQPSHLSIASPLGYEFTHPSPASISIENATLEISEGKTMSFIGGDIDIINSQLISPTGQLLLASSQSPGSWDITNEGLQHSKQDLGNISISQNKKLSPQLGNLNITEQNKINNSSLIQIVADNTTLSNANVLAISFDNTQGGKIQFFNSSDLHLDNSSVNTSVFAQGVGSSISVTAENLTLAGASDINSHVTIDAINGVGGEIVLTVDDAIILSDTGSEISSITQGFGVGGNISIQANTLKINNLAAIRTDTQHESQAGTIKIYANKLFMQTGGTISSVSSNFDPEIHAGTGGNIAIQTQSLSMADAETLISSSSFAHGGAGGNISIQTNTLNVSNTAEIQADSTSKSPAGNININNTDIFKIDNARINTEATAADGGQIVINSETLALRNSQITSSVEGLQGNGGNITLVADNLILHTGFIQANTTTVGGRGGDIQVKSERLLASRNVLTVGGDERLTFQKDSAINIIQAAAPDGISGDVSLNTVQLDISGDLADVGSKFAKPLTIANNPCLLARGIIPSSLVVNGEGALPVNANDTVGLSFIDYLELDLTDINRPQSGLRKTSPRNNPCG